LVFHLIEGRLQFLVIGSRVQVAPKVADVPSKFVPFACVEPRAVFLNAAGQMIPEMVAIPLATGETHNAQPRRQAFLSKVVIQCRYQFAPGQVAGGTEDHNRERFGIIHGLPLNPSKFIDVGGV
jgi:hypothetical protein